VTTPKRLIDERSGASDFEQSILRAELDGAAPPAGAEGAVLERVMASVVPVGAGFDPTAGASTAGGALGGAAKGATTLVTLGKGFALGIGVSVAAATGNHFLSERASSHEAASPLASAVSATSAAAKPPAPRRPETTVFVEPDAPVAPEGSHPAVTAPSRMPPAAGVSSAPSVASFPAADGPDSTASRLKEEAALLRRARAELRAGALTAAFATLEASRQRFIAPELSQEREALAIELLHRSGERAAAAERARAFLARFPDSPHAGAVRAFAAEAAR
jgi:hypothetical protein